MARFKTTLNAQTLPNGKANVLIRISHQGNIAYLATDLFIKPDYFNQSTGRAVKGSDIALFNHRISDIIGACQQAYWGIPNTESLSAYQIGDRLVNTEGLKAFKVDNRVGIAGL